MVGELLRLISEWIEFLWPLHKVNEWEVGAFYIFGKYRKLCNPGVYAKIPWFWDYRNTSIQWALFYGDRQDITLLDGATITFELSAWGRVIDIPKALNQVDNYQETCKEIMQANVADKMLDADPERFLPEKRKRVLTTIKKDVATEAMDYCGVELKDVRFKTFVYKPKTIRLMGDVSAVNEW